MIDKSSMTFYIGAATTGEGVGKWSAPARDLPLLYERKVVLGVESSLYPDLETWKRFGLVTFDTIINGNVQTNLLRVVQLVNQAGEQWVTEMLTKTSGVYRSHTRDNVLDWLGCPK